jgi:peptidoglycan/LPS O-acetylase OafA/YrhL
MKLSKSLSSYLDFMRFGAAFAVLLGHMDQDGIGSPWFLLGRFSHEAVIVFFVLSGFIIYSSTVGNKRTVTDYAIARASRIYSVALPAVAFSMLVSGLVTWLMPEVARQLSNFRPISWTDVVSCLFFLNESWMRLGDLSLNNPYWSVCYEVWYYVIFGCWFFARSTRQRVVLVALACLVAGPAILVLFPIWLMGAWLAAKGRNRLSGKPLLAALVFVLPIVAIGLQRWLGWDLMLRIYLHNTIPGYWRLMNSQRVVTDMLLGLLVTAHISAFSGLSPQIHMFFERHASKFGWWAGFSFTLYLFHRPITQLLGAYAPNESGHPVRVLVTAALVLAVCFWISLVTERQLPKLRRQLQRMQSV